MKPTTETNAKQAFVAACEANANAAAHARNADELRCFRIAAKCAGDAYGHAHPEYYTDGDTALDARVDAALDALELTQRKFDAARGVITMTPPNTAAEDRARRKAYDAIMGDHMRGKREVS